MLHKDMTFLISPRGSLHAAVCAIANCIYYMKQSCMVSLTSILLSGLSGAQCKFGARQDILTSSLAFNVFKLLTK